MKKDVDNFLFQNKKFSPPNIKEETVNQSSRKNLPLSFSPLFYKQKETTNFPLLILSAFPTEDVIKFPPLLFTTKLTGIKYKKKERDKITRERHNIVRINRNGYPRGIWLGFRRGPLIRNFHEPVKVIKHIYSKYMCPVQLVPIGLLPSKLSFLKQ